MFAALPVVRQLHELMWYLAEALKLDRAGRVHPRLRDALAETDRLAGGTPEETDRLPHADRAGKPEQAADADGPGNAGPDR